MFTKKIKIITIKTAVFTFSSFVFFSSPLVNTDTNIVYAETEKESKDYNIDDLYWDDTNYKVVAGWSEAEDKTTYKVKLYKGKKVASEYITTSRPSFDFTSYIIEKGTGKYKFVVYPRKLGRNSQKESEVLNIDSEFLKELKAKNPNLANKKNEKPKKPSLSEYKGAEKGFNGGPGTADIFSNKDANIPTLSTRGWNLYNNKWYYLDGNKQLVKSAWKSINNEWYYFDENAVMKTSWIKVNDLWYYLDNDGKLLVNTTTPDGYKVNADGVWVN